MIKNRLFDKFAAIAETIPTPFYWLDLKQQYLAINDAGLNAFGLNTRQQILNKTPHAIYSTEEADKIIQHHRQVIESKQTMQMEESIQDTKGNIQYYRTTITPLYDDKENLVGTSAISCNIPKQQKQPTMEKTNAHIFKQLEEIANVIPVPFYWGSLDHTLLGANHLFYEALGIIDCPEKYLGRTPYSVYPKEIADELAEKHRTIIESNQPLITQEKVTNITTSKTQYYEAVLAPLHDDDGNIIGVYGVSIDITAQKEAELFKQESEIKQAKLEQQQKFKKIASQAVHDIRSPIASLRMLLGSCKDIRESIRIALRDATNSINSIADNLLIQWKSDQENKPIETDHSEPMLVSLALLQVLTSKHYQYKDSPISFTPDFDKASYFSFIDINHSQFERMISNLINNAVAALDEQSMDIKINLSSDECQVKISIIDEGKGIPDDVLEKIRKQVMVTSGKKEGLGIGLSQVRDTLKCWQGTLQIDSQVGQGTTVNLTFPKCKAAEWFCDQITLYADDIIVILDDEPSIHQAWDAYFAQCGLTNTVQHFDIGQNTIDYLNNAIDKDKIFLLTDYELIEQTCNGLDVIEQTKVPHAVLVTSHHERQDVRKHALALGTKILPKQLASHIPIIVKEASTVSTTRHIDAIILDDNKNFTKAFALLHADKTVDTYYHPRDFLEQVYSYDKNTKILLDYHLSCNISGLDVAQQLNEAGYTQLYLISGDTFDSGEFPDYLNVVSKTDITEIQI